MPPALLADADASACFLCGATSPVLLFTRAKLQDLKCTRCGLVFIHGPPAEQKN